MTDHPQKKHGLASATLSQDEGSAVYCKGSLKGFLNVLLVSEQLSLVSALQGWWQSHVRTGDHRLG